MCAVKAPHGDSRESSSAKRDEHHCQSPSSSNADNHFNFSEFIENLPIGIYRTTRDGRIILANSALVHMLGYNSFEELARRNLEQDGLESEYPRKKFINIIEKESNVQGLCSIWKRVDGKRLYVSESARAVRDESGTTIYYEGTVEDISGKKWLTHPAASEIIETVAIVNSEQQTSYPVDVRTLALFEDAADPVYLISRNGNIVWMNPAWNAFTGYSSSEATGRPFVEFMHPEDTGIVRSDFRLALSGQLPPPRQTRYCHRTGEVRTAHRVVLPQFDPNHEIVGIFVTDHDITENLEKQMALQKSEEKYAKLFKHSSDMIFLHDEEGNIVDVNQRAIEALGYSYEEFLRLNVNDLHPKTSIYLAEDQLAEIKKKGYVSFETPFLTKNGDEQLAEVSASLFEAGDKILIQGIARDVSKWRKAERELLLAKQEWENIFQLMGQPALIIDTEQRIQKVNKAALQTFGLPERDLIGAHCYDKLPCKHKDIGLCPHIKSLDTGQIATEQVDWSSTGQCFIVSTSPVFDETGKIVAIVHLSTDITQQKEKAEKKQQLTIKMQQAQKLESLGMMAGGIAHDFNNLLVGVLGNVDLALLEAEKNSRLRPYLERILEGSNRLSELTNQILAFSGRGTFILKPVDISELVREITPLALTSASKKIAFHTELMPRPPSIEADSAQVQQVILNLLTNAFEAIGDTQGTVTITTGVEKRALTQNTGLEPSANQHAIFLKVTDTGCGILKENRGKIFDPFFSTKFTGRGLGLATVLGIVRSHRGEIEVHSVPGEGSSFTVYFPPSSPISEQELPPSNVDKPQFQGTVLVVDDEAIVREVAANMLTVSGFNVLTAADGGEALQIINQQQEIDAVLLDLTMPNLDGIETYSKLSAVRSDIPVILSSGYSEQAAIAKFKHQGLSGFLQKPYRIKALVDKIKSVISSGSD